MLTHMRTTIDLPNPIFQKAKRMARTRGVTLKHLVEDALRRYLAEEKEAANYQLTNASFAGDGLVSGLDWSDWDQLRELVYEDKGE